MAAFVYTALDAAGKRTKGSVDADSKAALKCVQDVFRAEVLKLDSSLPLLF